MPCPAFCCVLENFILISEGKLNLAEEKLSQSKASNDLRVEMQKHLVRLNLTTRGVGTNVPIFSGNWGDATRWIELCGLIQCCLLAIDWPIDSIENFNSIGNRLGFVFRLAFFGPILTKKMQF